MRKKLISVFLILGLLLPMFGYVTRAQENTTTTYTVEQVTSAADINSNNLYRYILVVERDDGSNVALAAVRSISASGYAISRNNYREVTIEDGKLSTETTDNILWNKESHYTFYW